MGQYLNMGSESFRESFESELYVDKSGLIIKLNRLLSSTQKYICVSRPRRFGKSMAMRMLAAYYSHGQDASKIFDQLEVSNSASYLQHLNQYDTLVLNIQEFLSATSSVDELIKQITDYLREEFLLAYPGIKLLNPENLLQIMKDVFQHSHRKFVILIDEWDCLFREYKEDTNAQKIYLDFLRMWLKDQSYVALAYMTGILPIKKYGTHSVLNMFREDSMTSPFRFPEYFGFTDDEVKNLCVQYEMKLDDIRTWYNGYFSEQGTPVYNPTSVSECLLLNRIANYWNKTETFEALANYIQLNFDGLRDKIIYMMGGGTVRVNPESFVNDMTTFNDADDVLTLLVHLGYLSYDPDYKRVRIPNNEVRAEFGTAVKVLKWSGVAQAVQKSDDLLQAVWNKNADFVAKNLQEIHEKNTSVLKYNDENSLACVLQLAFYTASEYYTVIPEMPSGKKDMQT
ncbi:MAG: AAA family ATPase [Turicibacter sp.]|nr:AAA family ATPase [Turicibacter sp.]